MSRRPDPDWLHDYLDGRLEGEALERAEARLRDDPELRERCADYREMGHRLREADVVPSDRFYRELRDRFVESRKRRSLWRHPWFAPALGISAAAALVLVLFIPEALKPGGLENLEESVGRQTRPQSQPADEDFSGLADAKEESDGRLEQDRNEGEGAEKSTAAGRAAPRERELRKEVRKKVAVGEEELAASADAEPQVAMDSGERARSKNVAGPSAMARAPAPIAEQAQVASAFPLRVGLLDEGELRNLQAETLASSVLPGYEVEPKEGERVVAIGRSAGAACRSVRIVRTDRGWEISVPEATGPVTNGGCAAILPDDGLPVVLRSEE